MILLISANDSLIEAFSAALPVSAPFIHLPTIAEAEPYLSSSASDKFETTLILVDTQRDRQVVAHCRQLCHENAASDIPIIALIAQPGDRQVVLEAGADDYLLLPLLPTEVQTRLGNYTRSSASGFNIWVDTFHQMSKGVSPGQVLNQSLKNLAQTFDAPSAWLYSFNPPKEITLVSSYKLPPLLQQNNMILNTEARICQEIHRQDGSNKAKIIPSPSLREAERQHTNGLTHYLSIPLNSHQYFMGILNLAYPEPPQLSRIEKQALTRLGQDIGILLEIFHLQEESQIYATQNAFMVLLAHTISEQLDLNTILSLSLEQTVPLLNASGGDIWLLSKDGKWLELSLSLSSTSVKRSLSHQIKGKGLIGWVADYGQPLCINENLTRDPRYDPTLDRIKGIETYSILAAPLHHRETNIGVVAIYNQHSIPFTNPDIILLEGIASLTASAITNARLMHELQDYAGQQRALYEMSQQIAAGLDLQVTLNRVLQWINHLCEVELGLLWLVEELEAQKDNDSVDTLRLVAALNTELLQEQQIVITAEQSLVGWVVHTGQAMMVNDLAHDSRFDSSIINLFGMEAHNVIAAPMVHHDQIIGAISMFNKIGGPFEEVDLILLSTAIEMIAVAVGNARLHTRTVTLMKEQERLHKQILQAERLATVGRLTASLSHEINNPMQTIQFALRLAKEELDNPQKLITYLDISVKESDRVVQLVSRMRQIYRPQSDVPEILDVNRLLQEAIDIARKELKRRDVTIEDHLALELPSLTAIANQLYLVFLSLMLKLGDAIGASGGGQLQLRSYALPHAILVEFNTNAPITSSLNQAIFERKDSPTQNGPTLAQAEADFSLSLSQDILLAHGGSMELEQQNGQTKCHIHLPLHSTNLPEGHNRYLHPHGDHNEPTTYLNR